MTYYEALGVSATASREEIRQAHKHLAGFIHPDQCGDEATRQLAELQLKRLNGIMEVLQDEAGRDSYDRSLAALAAAVSGNPLHSSPPAWDAHWTARAFLASSAMILILLILLTPYRQPAPAPGIPPIAGAAAAAPTARTERPAGVSTRTRPAEPELDWEPLASYTYQSHVSIPPLPFPEKPVRSVPIPAPQYAGLAGAAPALAGDWLFVPAASVEKSGYSPEYIELRIRQGEGGLVRGRYQAKYRVTDRAISPNVAFRFEGQINPEGGTLPWKSPSGAKGEVTLGLLPDGDLELKWKAAERGQEPGLASGRATLVRKME